MIFALSHTPFVDQKSRVGILHSNSAHCRFPPPLIIVADADAGINGNDEQIYVYDLELLCFDGSS